MKKLDPKYLAGLFDGDGCIQICKKKQKTNNKYYISYELQIIFTNTHLPILKMLKKNYQGGIYTDKRNWKKTNFRVHNWLISANKASKFLKDIFPHLIIKKKQAEISLDFQKRRYHSTLEKDRKSQLTLKAAKKEGREKWHNTI